MVVLVKSESGELERKVYMPGLQSHLHKLSESYKKLQPAVPRLEGFGIQNACCVQLDNNGKSTLQY